jgi:hypothetical protein
MFFDIIIHYETVESHSIPLHGGVLATLREQTISSIACSNTSLINLPDFQKPWLVLAQERLKSTLESEHSHM